MEEDFLDKFDTPEEETEGDKYSFKLENFEGPLDLLLHLIRETKMDIKNVEISKITEQYISYLHTMTLLDLEPASEFVQMAATLLEIKSKSMLPRDEILDEDGLDPEQKLIIQLQEYKIFKESAQKLEQLENVSRFYKNADKSVGEYRFVLGALTFDGLLNAFGEILLRIDEREAPPIQKKIDKDRFTVAQKISSIKDALLIKKSFSFYELFENDYSRGEIITTFLALLELLKMQIVAAEQCSPYENITIVYQGEGESYEQFE